MFGLLQSSRIRKLIEQLHHGDSRVKAKEELAKVGPAAIRPLLDEFADCHDYAIREHILIVLGEIGDASAARPLAEILRYGVQLELAERGRPILFFSLLDFRFPSAFRSIVQIEAGAVDSLVPLLTDDIHAMRWLAADALGRIGDPRAIEPLRAALSKNSDDILGTMEKALIALQKHAGSGPSFDFDGSNERINMGTARKLPGKEQEETILSKLANPGRYVHIVIVSSNSLQQIGGQAGLLIESIQGQLDMDVSRDLGEPCDVQWVQINPPVVTDKELTKIAKERWGGKILNTREYRISIKSFVSPLIGSGRALLIREALGGN